MEKVIEEKQCSGCQACANICPKKAISMIADEKGFLRPVIDQEKCINCGLCKRTCPVLKNVKTESLKKVYACYNKNEEERINSSSGGIFILLAKSIIKKDGVVFGAYLDEDQKVRHSYAETEEELVKFMGSKYVQSDVNETYKKVKEFLLQDRYVLFTGTPCQIEGLKAYLQKDYEKLYTQDIICHGAPSPLVWEKYKKYRKEIDVDTPIEISFRNKDEGWKLFNLKFSYKNKAYKKNQHEDLFMKAFLKNTILRDSCYNCAFKKLDRISDITLADFWGIQNVHPELDDNKGTSVLIVNSEKGKELFELIKEELVYTESNIEYVKQYNSSMIKSVNPDPNREKFFANLNEMTFDKLVAKYTYKKPLYRRVLGKIKRIIKKILGK